MLKAVTRQATRVDAKIRALNAARPESQHPISTAGFFDHHATPEDIAVSVTEQDFAEAQRELVPSVSAGELAHYERVRATFEGGRDGVPAAAQRRALVVPKTNAKVKGKAVVTSAAAKGKGKAVARDSDDAYTDSAEEQGVNGKDKGKAKAFHNGAASDDDGLYD
jgi:peroxin-6